MRKRKILQTFKKMMYLLLISLSIFSFGVTFKILSEKNQVYSATVDHNWFTDLSELKAEQPNLDINNHYVCLGDFYNKDPNGFFESAKATLPSSDDIIIIENAADFQAFTELCNVNDTYLTFHYVLGNNIDFIDSARYDKFAYPVGWNILAADESKMFTGIFDGNGFSISNIYYTPIDANSENDKNKYQIGGAFAIEYYSLFSQVGRNGIVKNIGLINPIILQGSSFDPMVNVSPLVGINYGLVENVYVQDTRSDSGIVANGDFDISGIMSVNVGIFRNAYAAYNSVISSSVNLFNTASPVLRYNKVSTDGGVTYTYGTYENLYYLNKADENHTLVNTYFDYNNIERTIAKSLDEDEFSSNLKTSESSSVWFDYNSYDIKINQTFPTLNGLRKNNDGNYEIHNAVDFVTMTKLIAQYPLFSTLKYEIKDNIDMSVLAKDAIVQTNISFKGELKSAINNDPAKQVKLANGYSSNRFTIYNLTINTGYSFNSYHAYGIFPFLEGTIDNVNFYNINVKVEDTLSINELESTSIGIVAGKIEKNGRVENVNVYGTIEVNNSSSPMQNASKITVGGITGYSLGTIINTTVSGTIDGGYHVANASSNDSAIGGIVGNVEKGSVQNVVNAATIKSMTYSTNATHNVNVGGIVGLATTVEFNKTVNKGTIYIGSSTNPQTASIYAGGIIGRHLDASYTVYHLFNQGDINYYYNQTSRTIRIAGALTVNNQASTLKYAQIRNAGTINISKNVTVSGTSASPFTANLYLGGVIYSENTNLSIDGIENVNYKYTNNYEEVSLKDGSTKYEYQKEAITSPQLIDISIIDEYGPVLRANNTTASITLENSANYRDITYQSSQDIYFNFLSLSGNTTGKRITYNGIRNEGNILVNILHNATLNLTINESNRIVKLLKVFGCFEEITDGYFAKNAYNGGKLEITTADNLSAFYFCIYVAGICYSNRNTSYITSNISGSRNPFDITNDYYDPNMKGTLDNAINNGEIYLHSGGSTKIYGVTRVVGICAYNLSLVTNCFNTANIWNENYIPQPGSSGTGTYYVGETLETESGGIIFENIGQYAQVRDSANCGDIMAYNKNDSGNTSGQTWVNAAGIVVRNDKHENGTDYGGGNNGHAFQTISFTINYGNIYSYNAAVNETNSWSESQCKSAGILGQGVCTVINVLNYGNIYSTRTASGIYGQVFLSKFGNDLGNNSTKTIMVSNSINYGKIRGLDVTSTSKPQYTSNQANNYGCVTFIFERSKNINIIKSHVAGALIGNLSSTTNLSRFSIRYLINFDDQVDIIGNFSGSGTLSVDKSNMATIKTTDNSPSPFNGIPTKLLDTSENGVFNINFPLRSPLTEGDPGYYITDKFIADYIQFIPFSKVNDYILDNLEWTDLAHTLSVNLFLNDLETVAKVIDSQLQKQDYQDINTILNKLLSSNALNNLLASTTDTSEALWKILDNSNNEEMLNLISLYLDVTNNYLLSTEGMTNVLEYISTNTTDTILIQKYEELFFTNERFNVYINSLSEEELRTFLTTWLNSVSFTDEELDQLMIELDIAIDNANKIRYILEQVADYNDFLNELLGNPSVTETIAINSIESLSDSEKKELITNLIENKIIDDNTNAFWNEMRNSTNIALLETILRNVTPGEEQLYYLANATSHIPDPTDTSNTNYQVDAERGTVISDSYLTANPSAKATYVGEFYFDSVNNKYDKYDYKTDLISENVMQVMITYSQSNDKNYYSYSSNAYSRTNRNSKGNYNIVYNIRDTGVFATYSVSTSWFTTTYKYSNIKIHTHMAVAITDVITQQTPFATNSEIIGWIKDGASNLNNTNDINSLLKILINYLYRSSSDEPSKEYLSNTIFSDDTAKNLITNIFNNQPDLIDNYFSKTPELCKQLIIEKLLTSRELIFGLVNTYYNRLSDDEKKTMLLNIANANGLTKADYLSLINSGILSSEWLINLVLANDTSIYSLYVNNKKSSNSLTLEQKRQIIHDLIMHSNADINKTLFPLLGINTIDNYQTIEGLLVEAGLSAGYYYDNIGIYALSSSFGILNGNFIPDNIDFSELDPIIATDGEAVIRDNTWRGGLDENGNMDISDQSLVNYKFNVRMKQLKKSIATTIFNAELVTIDEEGNEYYIPVSSIDTTKDSETLTFYVASNDIEITMSNFLINKVPGTYELSYGASFLNEAGNYVEEAVSPDAPLFLGTDPIGSEKYGYITVFAEDKTVSTKYKIVVVKTSPKAVNSLDRAMVNGTSSTFVNGTNSSTLNSSVNTSNGTLKLEYTLSNVTYNISLEENLILTHTDSSTVYPIGSLLNMSTDNNCIVTRPDAVIDPVGEGNLIVDLNIDSNMPGGNYSLELKLNESISYFVYFVKTKNTLANINSGIYNGEPIDISSSNNNFYTTSYIKVGTPITKEDFVLDNSVPKFLDELSISTQAVIKYANDASEPNVEVSYVDGLYQYRVTYVVTSEDGLSTVNYIYTLAEKIDNDNIDFAYYDGSLIEVENDSYAFDFNDSPTIRLDYNLNDFYFDSSYGTLSVIYPATYDDLGISVVVNLATGFEVTFSSVTPSGDYQFTLKYESMVPLMLIDTPSNHSFTTLTITKKANDDSLLVNARFITDTVIASIDTLITTREVTVEEFQNKYYNDVPIANAGAIKCLIDKIYYNMEYQYMQTFYVIGLVSNTNLVQYNPVFTLPVNAKVYRTEIINDAVYRYTNYVNGNGESLILLVSEDGQTFYDEDKKLLANVPSGYAESSLSGTPSDIALSANFESVYNEAGEPEFNYNNYRVYSEACLKGEVPNAYTDYQIAVNDITNNVKFNIQIFVKGETNVTNLPVVCLTLFNFELTSTKEKGELVNTMSIFSFSPETITPDASGNVLYYQKDECAANTAGWYEFALSLPIGYKFRFRTNSDRDSDWKESSEHYETPASLFTIVINLDILIEKESVNDKWGLNSIYPLK